jgi:hypothetical protein
LHNAEQCNLYSSLELAEFLNATSLRKLDYLKEMHLKKIMRFLQVNPSRLIYVLTKKPYLLEDL